jgi:membrane protease YdiL (CAAX protease family)
MISTSLKQRLGFFSLFLLFGLLASVLPLFLQNDVSFIFRIIVTIGFLLVAVWFRRKEGRRRFFQVVFGFFIMSFCWLTLSSLILTGLFSPSTIQSEFVFQMVNASIIIISIVLLTRVSGIDRGGIYFQKGRLRLGLLVGGGVLIAVVLLVLALPTGLSFLFPISEDMTFETMLSLMPVIIVYCVSNGFREELLFRGLFLKKFEPLIGAWSANAVTSLVFGLTHSTQQYSSSILVFFVILFLSGLLWGYLMQKTNSVIGSALFHAAWDIPIVIGIFSFMQ